MSCRELVNVIRRFFKENAEHYNIRYVIVYGSIARYKLSHLSDIDIAVKFSGNTSIEALLEISAKLEEITGIRIDIVSVDHVSLPLRYNILVNGELVYVKDYNVYIRDKWITTLKWLDYKDAYEHMHKKIIEIIKKR